MFIYNSVMNSFILDKLYEESYKTICHIRTVYVPKPTKEEKLKAEKNGYFL